MALIIIAISIFASTIHGYTIFDYNKDSNVELINYNQNVKASSSPNIILLSTSEVSVNDAKNNMFLANIPTKGFVSSEFGLRWGGFHRGFDIAADAGSNIYACANGVVEYSGSLGSYGLMVKIDHGNGYETIYAHCSKLIAEVGEKVQRGDKIAEVGSTGDSTGNHVHFEVIKNGERLNPRNYFIRSPEYGV